MAKSKMELKTTSKMELKTTGKMELKTTCSAESAWGPVIEKLRNTVRPLRRWRSSILQPIVPRWAVLRPVVRRQPGERPVLVPAAADAAGHSSSSNR